MKLRFFSRVTATALTLAMLLPCALTVPSSAAEDPAKHNLYSFSNPKLDKSARETFINQTFPSNIVFDYSDTTTNYNYPVGYLRFRNMYTENGPVYMTGYQMSGTHWPSISAGTMRKYSAFNGAPYRIMEGGEVKLMENLKFELGGVEYPIVTRGIGALNLAFDYTTGSSIMDICTANELRVYVSLDGENYLPDGVGIRTYKLMGGGTNDAGNRGKADFVMFHVETENLLDIPGLNPGDRINRIKVHVLDDDTSNGTVIGLLRMDVNSYDTVEDFQRLVPALDRKYVHVGEETMRKIAVQEGERTASIKWTTDTPVHTITGQNNMLHMPGIEYRGAAYGRDIDASRELFESAIVDGKWMGGYGQDNTYTMDCQSFVFNAVSRVSPAMGWACQYTMGAPGLSLLGEDFLNIPESIISYTDANLIAHNTQQDIFKSYALAKPGDQEVTYASVGGSHVRVVAYNHTEYNADGTIDGAKSYVLSTEQAMYPYYNVLLPDGTETRVQASGSTGYQKMLNYMAEHPGAKLLYGHAAMTGSQPNSGRQTYNSLYNSDYIIYTNDQYPAGDIELERVEILMMSKSADEPIEKAGLAVAFASNYRWIARDVVLEDLSTGEKMYDHHYIRSGSNSSSRGMWYSDALDNTLKNLTNGSYRLSFSLHSGPFTALGQSQVPITIKSYDFTITDNAPATKVTLNTPTSASKGQTVDVLVNTATAVDAADVTVKYDTSALTLKSVAQNANALVKKSTGMVAVMGAGMGVAANGQIAKLTFTANTDIAKLSDAVELKNASVVTAADANTANAVKALDVTEACPAINFGDVSKAAWYHDAVDFVLDNNVMSGFGGGRFAPDDKLDRAQVVQVLYNYEGQPATEAEGKFRDVKTSDWYFNATRWGAKKGVVTGYGDGSFKPNDKVTIEQVAVILHNYSGKPAATADLSSVGKYDDWAANGLQWAVANGVLKNVPFTNATETATRAQTAQMLTNFLSK